MISLSGAVGVIVYLVIGSVIFWLLNYLIDNVAPAGPFQKVAKTILLVLVILVLIGFLLSLLPGYGPIFRS